MVKVQDFIKTLNLQVLSSTSREEWDIPSVELNRPGLQFVGFYEHFAYERPQVVGLVEMTYLESLSEEERKQYATAGERLYIIKRKTENGKRKTSIFNRK